jgi:O-antigen ligase
MRLRRWLPPAVVLVVAGVIVLAVSGGDTTLDAIALVLIGVGAVVLVAGVFFEIGASEDRDRRSGRA